MVIGPVRKLSTGGLAGVWAEANTRADIFDAMRRREAFGTSGSRIKVRFFAGNYADDMGESPDAIATDGKRGDAHLAVSQGIDRLVVIAHHAIALTGEEPPRKEAELLERLCELADAPPEAVLERLAQLRDNHSLGDPVDAMDNVIDVVRAAKRWIDQLEVA